METLPREAPLLVAGEPLAELAELRLRVPPSHRALGGWSVTLAKRALLAALAPMIHRLLRPQVRFNRRLASLLGALPASPQALEALVRLDDAPPGRGALLGAQRAWNAELVTLLRTLSASWPPSGDAGERLASLEARADVLGTRGLPAWLRAGLPFWREAFRSQVEFNHACVRVLQRLHGTSRPLLLMPGAGAYASRWCAGEPEEMARAQAALATLPVRRFSLLTPLYDTPPEVLRACIQSVLAQSYPHWELCLVDDGSPDPRPAMIAREFAARDARVRFQRLERNAGIARATNAALEQATGEFVGLLDHDDLLAPHALAAMALRISTDPEVDVLYSDEDKVDPQGKRFAPHLKPALSRELLRAVNYVCHFLVVRAALLRAAGGIREGFEGAQDHDLLLRLSERTARFVHVPQVLYHWRSMPGSTSLDAGQKPRASEAGRRAVEEHLRRTGEEGAVEVISPGLYRVRRRLPPQQRVSVLLPARVSPERAASWAAQLSARTQGCHFELLVPAGDAAERGAGSGVRTIPSPEDQDFAALAQHLARQARGQVLVFMQPGLLPGTPGWLEELAAQALRPSVGVVGARLVHPDATLQASAFGLGALGQLVPLFDGLPDPSLTPFGGSHWPREVLCVGGGLVVLRRELFESLGGFTPGAGPLAGELELCLAARRQGLQVLLAPEARLFVDRAALAPTLTPSEAERLAQRFHEACPGGDPFCHPRLSPPSARAQPDVLV